MSANDITKDKLIEVARIELTDFFELKNHEKVLVLTDTFDDKLQQFRIADALNSAACEITDSNFMQFEPLIQSGIDPPEKIIKAMLKSDVILISTSKSLTHSSATVKAIGNGARIGTHTRHVESYCRAVIDASILRKRGDRLAKILNSYSGGTMHLTTEQGTDLTVPIGDRKFRNMAGDTRQPGKVENIPAGEVCIAPPEGYGEGQVVVNLLLPSWASGTLPYVMQVREGRLMECPQDSELIRKYKEKTGRDLLCEVAFGTNHAANKNAECIMEVEKVLGTAHVAFGSNVDFGGANQSDVHMDFVFDEVTLTIDGKTIIEKGKHCY